MTNEALLGQSENYFVYLLHLFVVFFRLELTNEALLGQSERLQERLKRLEEEGEISSRIIQVL